jgi:hypothetical protein
MNTMSINGEMSMLAFSCDFDLRRMAHSGSGVAEISPLSAEHVFELIEFVPKGLLSAIEHAPDDDPGNCDGEAHLRGEQSLRDAAGDAARLSEQSHLTEGIEGFDHADYRAQKASEGRNRYDRANHDLAAQKLFIEVAKGVLESVAKLPAVVAT